MPSKKDKWIEVDTRKLARGDWRVFDGFVHLLPRALAAIHIVDMDCWCDPKMIWPDGGNTMLVSHRDKRPSKEYV